MRNGSKMKTVLIDVPKRNCESECSLHISEDLVLLLY